MTAASAPTPKAKSYSATRAWGSWPACRRIWGLLDAEIAHETCLARGASECVYDVRWRARRSREGLVVGALGAGVVCGPAVAVAGGALAGALAAGLGAALGAATGFMWDRSREDRSARAFERNRIAALERGLELRGEIGGTPTDLTGTVLGAKYRIGRKIGSGGIGVVYAAEHVTLGHEVAVKVLRGAAARDGGEIARLRREAYIQVHVEHPNVVRVLDLDQMPDGSIYVIMERLIGRSLADKLSRDGLLAPGPRDYDLLARVPRPRRGPPEGRRPPRSEAGKHLPVRGRRRQGPRLRHEQARDAQNR